MLSGEIEIDESLFAKYKYKQGRIRGTMRSWVLGLKERRTGRCRFFIVGNNRSAASLLPLILRSVKPGSVIYTDKWREYNSLRENGYIHMKVDHSIQFVNRALEE